MTMQRLNRPLVLASVLAFTLLLVLWQWPATHDRSRWRHAQSPGTLLSFSKTGYRNRGATRAGNETLGFQAVLALSRGTKWRVEGLRAASRVSDITLTVPAQPQWSEPFVRAFEDFGPVEAHGAAMAWLGHIDLIKLVILNGWGSALIMEDDMDWDVDVRAQTPRIARAVAQLTNGTSTVQAPYGSDWDVMWLGHCSDPPPGNKDDVVIFDDPTTVDIDIYRGLNTHVKTLLSTGQRMVHFSVNPVCTFAYAVSATGAPKLLAYASLGKGGAFDLMLMHACQDKVLNCVSVNPEIFHPYQPVGTGTSEVRAGDAGDAVRVEVEKEMGWTENVLNSARCRGEYNKRCPWLPEYDKAEVSEPGPVGDAATGEDVGHEEDVVPIPDSGKVHDDMDSHELSQSLPNERLRARPIKEESQRSKEPVSLPHTGVKQDKKPDALPAGWADS